MRKEICAWVRLILAAGLDAGEDPYGAGFHLQQALEKSLKAFLLHHGWRLERTPNPATLPAAAPDYGADWTGYRALCDRVSDYYHAERYPDSGLAGPGMAEVAGDLAAAQELAREISAVISA